MALNLCETLEAMRGRNLLFCDGPSANGVWLPDNRTLLSEFGAARI